MISLRETERVALVKLLSDDDPTVLGLLKEQFIEMGTEGRVFLESVVQGNELMARRAAKQILHSLRQRDSDEVFSRFCVEDRSRFDLESGCWLLARTRYHELEEAPYRVRLDDMARELKERLTGRETPRATIEVCNRYFFRRLGFRGNEDDYYDPDNSYLNRVLDRRLGNPITFFDPFNEGQMLDREDCRTLAERLGHHFTPAFLASAHPRQMLLRMCRNLQSIHTESDPVRAEQLGRFASLLTPA